MWIELKDLGLKILVGFVLGAFILALGLVGRNIYLTLKIKNFEKKQWSLARQEIIASCSRDIKISKYSRHDAFEKDTAYLDFSCEGRELHYSNFSSNSNYWSWGDILRDSDYVAAQDESLQDEIMLIWAKTTDFNESKKAHEVRQSIHEEYTKAVQRMDVGYVENLKLENREKTEVRKFLQKMHEQEQRWKKLNP